MAITTLKFCLFLTCINYLAFSEPLHPTIQQPLTFKMASVFCEEQGKKMAVIDSENRETFYDRLKLNERSSDNITEAEYYTPVWTGVIYSHAKQMWVTNDGNEVQYDLDLMLNDTQLYANETCLAINITEFEIVDCTKELLFLCNSSDKEDFEARPSDLDSNPIPNPISSSTPNTTETYSDIETSPNSTSQTTDVEEEQDEQKINANSNTTNTTASNTETESEPAIPSSTSPTTILYDDQEPSSTPSTTTPNTTPNISENDCQIRINNKCYKYHINKPDTFKKANEICEHEHRKLARFENNEVITILINNYLKHQYDHFWVVSPVGVTCMKTFWEDTFEIVVDSTHCKNNIFFICESGSEKFRLVRKRVKNDVATDECTRSGEGLATIHVHGSTVIDNELIKVFKADKYWNTVTKEDLDRYSFSYSDAFWVGQENGDLVKNCSKISFNQTATITDCEENNMVVCEWEVEAESKTENVTYDTPSSIVVTTNHHADLPHTTSTSATTPKKQHEILVTSTKTSTVTSTVTPTVTSNVSETSTSRSLSSNTTNTELNQGSLNAGLVIGIVILVAIVIGVVFIAALAIKKPDKFKECLKRLNCCSEHENKDRPVNNKYYMPVNPEELFECRPNNEGEGECNGKETAV